MDAYTLNVATALTSAIMFLSLLTLYISGTKERCLLDWSLSGFLFFLNSCINLWAFYSPVPYIIGPGLANIFYFLAHIGILIGVRRHLKLTAHWRMARLFAMLIFISHFVPGLLITLSARLMFMYPLLMIINVVTVYVLVKATAKSPEYRLAYFPLMFAEVLFFSQQFVRFLMVLFDQQLPLTSAGNEFLQTSGTLAILAFLSLTNMACGLIVFRKQEIALRLASNTDQLTGWMNRGSLTDIAKQAFDMGKQDPTHKFSLVMLDVDHFKKINDNYGHKCGDMAIKHITQLAKQSLRESDYFFRYGGEEFLVMFTGVDRVTLNMMTQRLQERVERSPLIYRGEAISMTVSIGIAVQHQQDPHWEELLHRADLALYHSKEQGRNQISFHDGDDALVLDKLACT
ncbi:diguanylate cyclase [Shewanella maritima]|uniref:GGDEF domain-containing protein n=1 Tax=Shewanella maritima TaxID=2520507 RepID=UPI00373566D6